MVVGDVPEPSDLLVVGGGPGGYAAAIAAAQLGRSVMLVDRNDWDGLGGTCLHVGCIPSKTLIHLGDAAAERRLDPIPGLVAGNVEVDMSAFQDHKRSVIGRLARGVDALMRHYGIATVTGELRFTGLRRAVVTNTERPKHFEFNDIVLAVGSRPTGLAELGSFDGERILDSAGLLALEELPASVCVIGGGYIGLELGTALAKLGTKVTVVEALDRVAAAHEDDVSRVVTRSLERFGVDVLLGAVATGVDDAHVIVRLASGEERRVAAERVVIAVGREPNTAGVGLERLEVRLDDRGLVRVTDSLVAAPHVAAIGDVVAGPALAHKATAEADVAVRALGGQRVTFVPNAIPVVMFTDPEVATTGLTEEQAKADGMDVLTGVFPFGALGRAATLGRREGFVRAVSERGDGRIVGVQIVGARASELIAEATLAIEMGVTLEDLALTIHPHPTLSEGFSEVAKLLLGHPLHVPAVDASALTAA